MKSKFCSYSLGLYTAKVCRNFYCLVLSQIQILEVGSYNTQPGGVRFSAKTKIMVLHNIFSMPGIPGFNHTWHTPVISTKVGRGGINKNEYISTRISVIITLNYSNIPISILLLLYQITCYSNCFNNPKSKKYKKVTNCSKILILTKHAPKSSK